MATLLMEILCPPKPPNSMNIEIQLLKRLLQRHHNQLQNNLIMLLPMLNKPLKLGLEFLF